MNREQCATVHALSKGFSYRLAQARVIVGDALATAPTWNVALSGGKDSTVVLNLVREQKPDTPAVISIHKWRLPETTDYLSRIKNLHYVASGSKHGTSWAANWKDRAEANAVFPDIPWFDKDADKFAMGRDEDGVFLGLRKAENNYRRIHLSRFGSLYFAKGKQKWQCNPIAEWSALDVWAFIYSQRIDYNRAYDVMERIGLSLERQRIGPLAIEKILPLGQLVTLKRGWPDLFNRYAMDHPEARNHI